MIECSIVDFYNFVQEKNIDLLEEFVEVTSKGVNGSKQVRVLGVGLTEKNTTTFSVHVDGGYIFTASKSHKIYKFPQSETTLNHLRIGDSVWTEEGFMTVLAIVKNVEKADLYDLEVEGEWFFADGILSHNSTISNTLKLALYGKVKGKTNADVVNRKNKHAEMYVKFIHRSGQTVEIDRKILPSGLELRVDGEIVSKESNTTLQKYIEDEMLEMSSDVFNNMVSLSLTDFNSFLTMNPESKRKIVDKIFSLSIYNDVRKRVKKIIQDINNDVISSEKSIETVVSLIESNSKEIEKITNEIKEDNTLKLKDIEEKLFVLKKNEEVINNNISKIEEKKILLSEVINEVNPKIYELKSNIKSINNSLKLYEDDKCPTCQADLKGAEHIERKEEMESEVEKLKIDLSNYVEKYESLTEKKNVIDSKYEEMVSKKYKVQNQKRTLQNEIQKLQTENVETKSIESLQKLLEEAETKKNLLSDNIKKRYNKKKYWSLVEEVVSEKGIKSLVIANIVPFINSYINQYMSKFDLTFSVEFDEMFNSKLMQYGVEILPATLSGGESKLLDFCVLLAMVKLLKTKYINLNVLFLDELFSELDPDNVKYVIEVLSQLKKELKLNIFIIHQTLLPVEYFDNIIRTNKINGFSEFEVVKAE